MAALLGQAIGVVTNKSDHLNLALFASNEFRICSFETIFRIRNSSVSDRQTREAAACRKDRLARSILSYEVSARSARTTTTPAIFHGIGLGIGTAPPSARARDVEPEDPEADCAEFAEY